MARTRSAAPTATAATYEERIAPLLDALGRHLEAAASRISAASCYHKGGDPSRAANLYQAALAAPLRPNTRRDVSAMLAACLDELSAPRRTAHRDDAEKCGREREVDEGWMAGRSFSAGGFGEKMNRHQLFRSHYSARMFC